MEENMMKVLVVVDMQNDFIDGSLGSKEAVQIVPNVINKIKEYEDNNDLIIYTKDTHFENYLDTLEGKNLPVEHCIKGTKGHDIPDSILRGHDVIFEKLTFGSIELIEYLKGIEFDEIELIGLCTDICVISNALLVKAHFYNKIVKVDSSCTAGVSVKSHNEALNTMKMCQIQVI